ncbi:Rieske 2Fe-2S domain-containing protein [Hydrogenophaga sp.]|uniref:Rieske 2Fe-2S domain-containing protein n=1 Tax=Hydrogenophaga sp. TaxID=1904254 RepID=UPI002717764A|nr:Rieske 2Fe-2S domain-containing protein [Hydrogenophaga sp.]MDO9436552.1 Rieske 2Fe-2S domain-containing protein [Hydrogenophaga sp.]
MLSKEDNQLLCQIGPGTPMGDVFRRYWNPVLLSEDLPGADSDPVRVRILGEDLVAFRNSDGAVGLLAEGCLHRGVSLALGRVEGNGIRCLYHGWKFAATGQLLETPNTPDVRIRERLKARAYPTREAGGLVWAYMGPAEHEPPMPAWSFMNVATANLKVVRLDSGSNYMQLVEGGADSSHVGILHTNFARPGWITGEFRANEEEDNPAALATNDMAPTLDIEDTEFGFHYAAVRALPDEGGQARKNIRIVPLVMPSTRIIPSPAMQFVVFEVPIDDHNTRTISVAHRTDGGHFETGKRYDEMRGRDNPALLDQKTFVYLGNWDNRFGQDRKAMAEDWSGIRGVVMEDLAMSMSPGPIVDRSAEHLVAADAAVVRARRQLLDSVRLLQAGQSPIGVKADLSRVAACDETTPAATPWKALAPGHHARVAR